MIIQTIQRNVLATSETMLEAGLAVYDGLPNAVEMLAQLHNERRVFAHDREKWRALAELRARKLQKYAVLAGVGWTGFVVSMVVIWAVKP